MWDRDPVPEAEEPAVAGDGRLSWIWMVVPLALFFTVLGFLVRTATLPLTNPDTYFHLRFGDEFLAGWSLRHPGSVTSFATAHWLPTQWAAEITMAKFEGWFGLGGVAWLSGCLILAYAVVIFLVCRRHAALNVAALVTFLAVVASGPGLSARPQVISYILAVVTTAAWVRTGTDQRARWWLIPLTWLWATLHGMWPVGIVIGFAAVLGILLDRQVTRAALPKLIAVPVLSAVAAAVTPVGPGLYGAVLLVGSRGHYFTEWGPPDFMTPANFTLAIMLAIVIVVNMSRGPTNWRRIILIGLAGAFAIYSSRTVPIAAGVLAPVIAMTLQSLAGSEITFGRRERLAVAAGIVVSLIALTALVPAAAKGVTEPSWEEPALSGLPNHTKLLNDDALGGYLMWRYPRLDLVMDGYGDTFTDAELKRYVDLTNVAPGWDQLLHETGARLALLRPSSSLAYALQTAERWKVVHESKDLVLLQAPAGWSAG
jgi:hypothetical protein